VEKGKRNGGKGDSVPVPPRNKIRRELTDDSLNLFFSYIGSLVSGFSRPDV